MDQWQFVQPVIDIVTIIVFICFTLLFCISGDKKWLELDDSRRKSHIMRLLNAMEVSDHDQRMTAVRAILYIAQGS